MNGYGQNKNGVQRPATNVLRNWREKNNETKRILALV